jgi:predicted nucleic acid-binding protein
MVANAIFGFNQSGRRSKSFADCCIAAVAMRCNAGLASGNRADFEPLIPFGLKLL